MAPIEFFFNASLDAYVMCCMAKIVEGLIMELDPQFLE
jgi:hypothetical protein